MSEQTVDTAFLRGMKKEELSALITNGDPRIKQVLSDPKLKKELYEGKLTKPLENAPTLESQVTAAPVALAVAPVPVKDPLLEKLGYDSQEALIKNIEDQKTYIKNLERQRDELNARAGAEGGPLGKKVKELEELIPRLQSELAEARKRPEPVQTDMSAREILELYEPSFTEIDPANFSDPEAVKVMQKQQVEFKKFVSSLKGTIGKLSPANAQRQLMEVNRKYEDLQGKYDILAQKDEMREVKLHTEESQQSFSSIYDEADAFVKSIGIKPTRHFGEIDRAIAASGDPGSEARIAFLKILPEQDRLAWENAMPLINQYGRVVEIPVNGGRAKTVRFEKYGNIGSLGDLYYLELLKSGKLNEQKKREILEAHRAGAQSVLQSTAIPPNVKGLPDTASQGEHLPAESTFDEKKKRLQQLMGMGVELLKDRKLNEEYKSLKKDVYGAAKQQMAQGVFKRKR